MTITQTQGMRFPLAFSGAFKPSFYPPGEDIFPLLLAFIAYYSTHTACQTIKWLQ